MEEKREIHTYIHDNGETRIRMGTTRCRVVIGERKEGTVRCRVVIGGRLRELVGV